MYPPEIYLDPETEERLIQYIESELLNHYSERGPHIEDLIRMQRDYWAAPLNKEATFPFKGAATIIIPLSAIAVEAVHARTMQMTFGYPHLVSAKGTSATWMQYERAFERFMDYELLRQVKIRDFCNSAYLEGEKFGTMIGKVGYERTIKYAVREIQTPELAPFQPAAGPNLTPQSDFLGEGTIPQVRTETEVVPVVTKDGAVVDNVADARFLMPYYAKDPQTSPWVGEEHSANRYEIEQLESGGLFRPGTIIPSSADEDDSVLGKWVMQTATQPAESTGRDFDESQERLEKTEPAWPQKIEWVELWLAFDTDKSGQNKEIVVHYHRPSRSFLSIRYNWHSDLHRPYRVGNYFPVEHRWRGIGICKINEQFQREITTQHRQRLDNATLANMRMIVIHKLSGYGPKEPIFPGKMWFVDDMTHISTVQMGDVYASSYSNEQATLIYSQQRTGVNEVTLGMPQAGTPGTATSDLARIQEGNMKFDFVYANFREFLEEIITDVAVTVQQFGPRKLRYFDTNENGDLVAQFFTMPEDLIRDNLLIDLRIAGQQKNKVLDRQNWQQIAAHIQAYYTGLIQLAQPLGQPELIQLILTKGLGAATEAMRQILESFDVRNIDRIVLREIEEMFNQPLGGNNVNGPNRLGPESNGGGGNPQASQLFGIDQLAQILSSPQTNGSQGSSRLPNTFTGV